SARLRPDAGITSQAAHAGHDEIRIRNRRKEGEAVRLRPRGRENPERGQHRCQRAAAELGRCRLVAHLVAGTILTESEPITRAPLNVFACRNATVSPRLSSNAWVFTCTTRSRRPSPLTSWKDAMAVPLPLTLTSAPASSTLS